MNENVKNAKIFAVYENRNEIIHIEGDSMALLLILVSIMREFDKKKAPIVAIAKMAALAEEDEDYDCFLKIFHNDFARRGHDGMTERELVSLMLLAKAKYADHEKDGEK